MPRRWPDRGGVRPRAGDAPASPLLELAAVTKRIADGPRTVTLLDSIAFELRPGEIAGLYGAPRSGKSTLLRLACGVEQPDRGTVRFEGADIARMPGRQRARLLRCQIALITADGWMPGPGESVLDHLATSLGSAGLTLDQARRAGQAALELVGVAGLAQDPAGSLSRTQRARADLARGLARNPKLLLVDEPAPVPSLAERERFLALLRDIVSQRGIALLIASEDMAALQGAHTLMSLSSGELRSTASSATVVPLRRSGAAGGS